MAEPANAFIPTDNPRAFQAQIDDVRAALEDWRRTREYSQPTLTRLAQITMQCARMVESWQEMEQRPGAPGGDQAGDQAAGDGGVNPESGERIRALERTIEHEWRALRDYHDEPGGQLRDQAASLAESCVTAANLTLRGLERTESRLAALEQDLHGSMAQLSRDLQAVVAELRNARSHALPGAAAPAFPLESVMRIHEELRDSDAKAPAAPDALKSAPAPRALPEWAESATALTARMESLERAVGKPTTTSPRATGWWRPLYTVGVVIVALAGAAVFTMWMQRRLDARLNDAAARVADTERQSAATNAATRAEAARQVSEARQSAARAQIVGNILAAPDLVRYWLVGEVDANPRPYAQVLFSRSRGMVFSASRLPAAGAGKTYQLWLLTRGGPVSGGLITPDTAGRVTLATDVPLTVPSRLAGALVTLEAAGGASQPSADKVLILAE